MSGAAIRPAVGERIRQLRHQWSYTQEALADELNSALGTGYNKSSISKWERGLNRTPQEVLEELERLFGMRQGSLLEGFGYLEDAVRLGRRRL
jgi:transcriptional regulator with XRE-family HTH domain